MWNCCLVGTGTDTLQKATSVSRLYIATVVDSRHTFSWPRCVKFHYSITFSSTCLRIKNFFCVLCNLFVLFVLYITSFNYILYNIFLHYHLSFSLWQENLISCFCLHVVCVAHIFSDYRHMKRFVLHTKTSKFRSPKIEF